MTAAQRTPGKWEIFVPPAGNDEIVNDEGHTVCEFPYGASEGSEGHADAQFIVLACNSHDDLLADVAKLRANLRNTVAWIEQARNDGCKLPSEATLADARAALQSTAGGTAP